MGANRGQIAFRPGDVIGFSSRDPIGRAINCGTWGMPYLKLLAGDFWGVSRWGLSHVGIVAGFPGTPDYMILWESTSLLKAPCCLQGRVVSGVQAHLLDGRIGTYLGDVYQYPLAKPLTPGEGLDLTAFLNSLLGRPYDTWGAVQARDMPLAEVYQRFHGEDLGSLFCSELVVAALEKVGRWERTNASAYNPNMLHRHGMKRGIFSGRRRLQ